MKTWVYIRIVVPDPDPIPEKKTFKKNEILIRLRSGSEFDLVKLILFFFLSI